MPLKLLHGSHGWGKVRVPRHEHGGVKEVEMGVSHHLNGQVDVRLFSSKSAHVCPQRRQRPSRGWNFPSMIRTPVAARAST